MTDAAFDAAFNTFRRSPFGSQASDPSSVFQSLGAVPTQTPGTAEDISFPPNLAGFIFYRLENGDFSAPPPDPSLPIDNVTNKLPGWMLVYDGDPTNTTATWVATTAGGKINFLHNPGGVTTTDVYLEQQTAVAGSDASPMIYALNANVAAGSGGTTGGSAFAEAQFLDASSIAVGAATRTSITRNNLSTGPALLIALADTTGQPDETVAFVAVRVGYHCTGVTGAIAALNVYVTETPEHGIAPADADYLIGTINADLPSAIVVGTTPGGELGNTWASPTVDTTHSGSSHAGVVSTHVGLADPHTQYALDTDLSSYVAKSTAVDQTIVTTVAGSIPLIVKGAGSQTADIFQVQDSSANAIIEVLPAGRIISAGTSAFQWQGVHWSADAVGPMTLLLKSRGAFGVNTIVQSGDNLGGFDARGANGTGFTQAAQIVFEVDGTPGAANDMPGRVRVLTTPDGAGTAVERLRIDNAGLFTVWDGGNVALGTTTGTKIGTATTQRLGFFNATPIVQGSAFTQTYSTASHTHAAITASNPPAGGTGATAGAYDTAANRNAMITSLTNNIADVANLKQVVNALIDDLQALGLIA